MRWFTSSAAARYLRVSAASVKRWSDAGLLECEKTAGKHRRFSKEALDSFQRRRGQSEEEPVATASARETALIDEWLEELLEVSDSHAIDALLMRERNRLGRWSSVAKSLGSVVTELGARWARGDLNPIDEHVATERLSRALARTAQWLPNAKDAPTCMLTTAEGDNHTLGLSLLEVCMREAGWMTVWSGRRTPFANLDTAIERYNIDLLAVSASAISSEPHEMRLQAEGLGRILEPRGVDLILGGCGSWPDPPPYGLVIRDFEEISHEARKIINSASIGAYDDDP
ncbi:MAG: helix-turn-helix domain-containing protein [Myxococcota bacterium]